MQAIEKAGYKPGKDVFIAMDPRSSEFYKDGKYDYDGEGKLPPTRWSIIRQDGQEISNRFHRGRSGPRMTGMGGRADRQARRKNPAGRATTFSSPTSKCLQQGHRKGIANSILIKVNQIGTFTETLDAIEMAKKHKYTSVISHRSGETEDVDDRPSCGRHERRPDQDRFSCRERTDRRSTMNFCASRKNSVKGGLRRPYLGQDFANHKGHEGLKAR